MHLTYLSLICIPSFDKRSAYLPIYKTISGIARTPIALAAFALMCVPHFVNVCANLCGLCVGTIPKLFDNLRLFAVLGFLILVHIIVVLERAGGKCMCTN